MEALKESRATIMEATLYAQVSLEINGWLSPSSSSFFPITLGKILFSICHPPGSNLGRIVIPTSCVLRWLPLLPPSQSLRKGEIPHHRRPLLHPTRPRFTSSRNDTRTLFTTCIICHVKIICQITKEKKVKLKSTKYCLIQ